ncbi:beta-1,3-galactosyltransferase 1 [Lingula anatina]|uniref:Hexosyltransferase n=1 Tax=Lingula anatina TaxID=7574 RepID=A0A1S3JXT5_LINAN|nr:beta-1,3-galactosyltransferase 1 [Lingula anatina]|eukprot:XP_013414866.1 beta-1,3-galactosyltransferase 1 [Lingula anatina]
MRRLKLTQKLVLSFLSILVSYFLISWILYHKPFDKHGLTNTDGHRGKSSIQTALQGTLYDNEKRENRQQDRILDFETEKNFFTTRSSIINPLNHSLLISPRDFCGNDVTILIVVLSEFTNLVRRKTIRNTWASTLEKPEGVRIAFIFGQQSAKKWNDRLEEESQKYQDIIKYDFPDIYSNLILKSLSILRWATDHCKNVNFVMKVDDDVFIMTSRLHSYFERLYPKRILRGHYNAHYTVLRDGKWLVTRDQYPFSEFPPYIAGGAYIMSLDVAETLFEAAKRVPLLPIEDAFITGILAKITGITIFSDGQFLTQFAHENLEIQSTICSKSYGSVLAILLGAPDEHSISKLMLLVNKCYREVQRLQALYGPKPPWRQH